MLPIIAPMLATAAMHLPRGEWAVEPKLDGWRAMVYVDSDRHRVLTRRGRDVTGSVPELADVAAAVDGHQVVLDGELVAGAGLPGDFYRLAPTLAGRRHRLPVTFVAFDLLHLDGEPLLDLPYRERRPLLDGLGLAGGGCCLAPSLRGDLVDVLPAVIEHGLEGAVLKRVDSPYQPGRRSRHWVKVKTTEWRHEHAPLRHERRGLALAR